MAILSAALVMTALGCHSARRGEPIVGTLPITDPQVERGRIVFMQYCNSCHPGGEGGLGPALNNKPAPRFLMKTQVRLGLGAMPSFDAHKLPPHQLDDVTKYLVALRKHDQPLR
jgi:mono/diheme cytochrome c family protein